MALYYPKPIYPANGDVIDPAIATTFIYQIQGSSSAIAYQEIILTTDNVAVYTGTKTTLSTPLYNGENLSITLSTSNLSGLTTGTAYKHKVLVYYTSTLYVTSLETLFYAYTTATLSINMPSTIPYNLQSYTFTLNYVQAQGIGIKEFEYKFYDNAMTLLDTYNVIGSSKTDYPVDGLKSGETYFTQATVTNQMGIVTVSDLEEFSVSYDVAKYVVDPVLTNNTDKFAVDVSWSASQISGVPSTDIIYSYISSFMYASNTGLRIDSGSIIYKDIVFTDNSTLLYVFCPIYGTSGTLLSFTDESENIYTLSFDGINIIYAKNGATIGSQSTTSYGLNYWKVAMQSTAAYFTFIETSEIYPSDTTYPSSTLYPVTLV